MNMAVVRASASATAPPRRSDRMPKPTLAGKLVVAISSRALFDLARATACSEEGVEAYHRYQLEHEDEMLAPGIAFALVKKLLASIAPDKQYVEVILLSRNTADTGLRVFNSIQHYGLDITRAAFTKGEATSPYVPAFGAHLFLSADTGRRAAGARRRPRRGDDPAERGRAERDRRAAHRLRRRRGAVLRRGRARLQGGGARRVHEERSRGGAASRCPAGRSRTSSPRCIASRPSSRRIASPIRTALVTARSAPAHERVVRTLRAWNIRIDEALFLGGLDKGQFLQAFGADIFFDDQRSHVESAASTSPPAMCRTASPTKRSAGPVSAPANPLTLAHWRRSVAEPLRGGRALAGDAIRPAAALRFRAARERLFREHPESPIAPRAPSRLAGPRLVRPRSGVARRGDVRAPRRAHRSSTSRWPPTACCAARASARSVSRCAARGGARRVLARGLRRRAVAAVSDAIERRDDVRRRPLSLRHDQGRRPRRRRRAPSCSISTSRTTRRARTTSAGRARCRRRRTGCRSR